MAQNLSVSEWVDHIDKEYLSTFIKHGGATIKFVVPDDEAVKSVLKQSMKDKAKDLGYEIIDINAVDCRFHMPQDIFFALARQIDWRLMTRKFILRLATKKFRRPVNDIDPKNEDICEEIATQYNLTKDDVKDEMRREIYKFLPKRTMAKVNKTMARDFRVAMRRLCLIELDSGELDSGERYEGQPIIDWLEDSDTRITNVKEFSIHTPINRTTARIFLESALYWFHEVGIPGTLIMLDNSRVTVSKRPADGSRYYTRPMAMEHYELLRQFIDSAERLKSTAILTISNQEFLNMETDQKARGIGIYPALKTRIMDDVYDRKLVNPNASLLRLS